MIVELVYKSFSFLLLRSDKRTFVLVVYNGLKCVNLGV